MDNESITLVNTNNSSPQISQKKSKQQIQNKVHDDDDIYS